MSNTLLPCPFCGGEALMRERYINGIANTKHYRRECHHCKATFAHWFRSVKKADAAWNRRANPDVGNPISEPVTNADRIRAMSDEELAEWIDKLERERDKAVEDMTAMSNLSEGVEICEFCKWYRNEICQKPGMFNTSACFEWRGIKEGE